MILKCIDCQRDLLELLQIAQARCPCGDESFVHKSEYKVRIHAIAGLEIVDFLDEDNKDIVVLKGSKDEK